MLLNQLINLTASINQILFTDEMTLERKKININIVEDMTTEELKEN